MALRAKIECVTFIDNCFDMRALHQHSLLSLCAQIAALAALGLTSPCQAQMGQNLPDTFPYQLVPFFRDQSEPRDLDGAKFQYQVAQNPGISVVEFMLPTCLACNPVSREVNKLVSTYKGDVTYLRMDVNKNLHLSFQYDVPKVPTILLFSNGKLIEKFPEFKAEEKDRLASSIDKEVQKLTRSVAATGKNPNQ